MDELRPLYFQDKEPYRYYLFEGKYFKRLQQSNLFTEIGEKEYLPLLFTWNLVAGGYRYWLKDLFLQGLIKLTKEEIKHLLSVYNYDTYAYKLLKDKAERVYEDFVL